TNSVVQVSCKHFSLYNDILVGKRYLRCICKTDLLMHHQPDLRKKKERKLRETIEGKNNRKKIFGSEGSILSCPISCPIIFHTITPVIMGVEKSKIVSNMELTNLNIREQNIDGSDPLGCVSHIRFTTIDTCALDELVVLIFLSFNMTVMGDKTKRGICVHFVLFLHDIATEFWLQLA
ncbi:hypothetical protein ACJX0J_009896, partial [Zea mays]